MRSTVVESGLLAAAMLVAGCAAPPKPSAPVLAPTPAPVAVTPVKQAAVLQPGCLMPQPGDHGAAGGGSAALRLQVTATGDVGSAVVVRSSGSPALDSALAAAARGCKFSPAYTMDPSTHQRVNVEDDHILNASWPQPALVGPLRCFAPEYPLVVRRREEEGTVVVRFRLNGNSGALETRVAPESAAGSGIRALSIRAVEACVTNHVEARSSLRPDTWYAIPYTWRLE